MNNQTEVNSKSGTTTTDNKGGKAFERSGKSPIIEKSNVMEDHKEGLMTKAVEKETSKIPSIAFLAFAAGSMALALGLAVRSERKGWANFVGLWAPTFLLLGIYNKIVKTHGSDTHEAMGYDFSS